jgi:hypothetical protein
MEILSLLFMDDIALRPVPGPSTRIDLTGIQFSAPAPGPVPVTIAPHLVVFVWAPPDSNGFGALTVTFHRQDAEEGDDPIARNVQALQVEPGKFNYSLVRADLLFDDYSTVIARAQIDDGPQRVAPFTLLPPVS